MPVNKNLLQGPTPFVENDTILESFQRRLQSLNCVASIEQVRGYLAQSGKTASEITKLEDEPVKTWFGNCLNGVYDSVATRPSTMFIN